LKSSVVVMSAYSFLRPQTRALASEVAELVAGTQTRLVLDAASSAPIADVGVDLVRSYLMNADLILANEDEFATLDEPSWTNYGPNLIVKLGPDGSKWLQHGQAVAQTNAIQVDVIDTTGAGDSFLAGLISVLADYQDWNALDNEVLNAALIRASEVAASNVVSVGAGPI
jgi:sugar/nucleoside kinase (ribokinase family)